MISGVVRGVGAEIQMETALKARVARTEDPLASHCAAQELLVSSSFELRTSALNVQAASELLMTRNSVSGDKEAAFLANAAYTSCKQLLGIISNSVSARDATPSALANHTCCPSLCFTQSSRRAIWSTTSCAS